MSGDGLTLPVGKLWGELIMLYVRCTKKLIDELTRNGHSLAGEPDDIPVLHEWYANIFRIERRKCCLFTHATTLFSFFVPGLTKPAFVNFQATFNKNLDLALRAEGLMMAPAEADAAPESGLGILKTSSRSVLGSMNDFIYGIHDYVELDGGLAYCDVQDVNNRLNSTPMGALDYAYPINAFAEALVKHGPKLGL